MVANGSFLGNAAEPHSPSSPRGLRIHRAMLVRGAYRRTDDGHLLSNRPRNALPVALSRKQSAVASSRPILERRPLGLRALTFPSPTRLEGRRSLEQTPPNALPCWYSPGAKDRPTSPE